MEKRSVVAEHQYDVAYFQRKGGKAMKVKDILRSTKKDVVTAVPQTCVIELLSILTEHNIGAVVISETGQDIVGIVSERDIIRALDRIGSDVLAEPAVAVMSGDVITCGPQQSTETIGQIMTTHRIRHVPVIDEDGLMGLVSIGDIVNSRIVELTSERDDLVSYINK